jgi:hypothetical protein
MHGVDRMNAPSIHHCKTVRISQQIGATGIGLRAVRTSAAQRISQRLRCNIFGYIVAIQLRDDHFIYTLCL